MGIKLQQGLEIKFNASLKDILKSLSDEGLNKITAAERLGVTKKTLLSWIDRYDVEWPNYTKEHQEKRRKFLTSKCIYQIEYNGKTIPLFEAAEKEKISYKVVLERFKKGDRGKRLFRPVRVYNRIPPPEKLGLNEEEWKIACLLAKEIGSQKAAQKFNIKMKYLSMALKRMEQE